MFLLIKTSNKRLLALITFYLFYLFFGAFMFDQLESPHESKIIRELNQYVREFREIHKGCLTDQELHTFIKLISMANDKGVPATRNVSKEQNWSFGQAVFFAGTVLTTIGYGDVTVQTQLGKVFCILFALIGIPATLLLLYSIIERLMKLTNYMLVFFTDFFHPILKNISLLSEKIQRSHMHVLFTLFCSLIVLVFFFIIPATIYSSIEGWSFLNAFYYCFISLSTVGLGDYVPGDQVNQQNRHLYKIISTVYLIVGVMVMVWLLQIFSETPEFNFYKYFTLTKDGILTSHRDTIHLATSSDGKSYGGSGSDSFGGSSNLSSSKITYQKQLNDNSNVQYDSINSNTSAGVIKNASTDPINDNSQSALNTSNAPTHNYMSLASLTKSN